MDSISSDSSVCGLGSFHPPSVSTEVKLSVWWHRGNGDRNISLLTQPQWNGERVEPACSLRVHRTPPFSLMLSMSMLLWLISRAEVLKLGYAFPRVFCFIFKQKICLKILLFNLVNGIYFDFLSNMKFLTID